MWPWLAVAVGLVVLALITPVNHDEHQYVVGSALVARGLRPFGDFMYLQTPVQAWLLAPVVSLTQGWSFAALRLVNAVAGLVTLVLLFAAQRRAGVAARPALVATLLCASCVPFLFGASLARNDALPALLLAVALWAGARGRTLDWGVAGLALGIAASIKISYGVPLAFGGFWLLWQAWRTRSVAPTLAWGIGGVIGLLPTVLTWAAHSAAFEYGVFVYAAEGAKIWYDLNGIGDRLSLLAKLRDTGIALAMGPALVAVVVLLFRRQSGEGRNDGKYRSFVVTLLVAGMLAAVLPTPTYRQYFLPALPPMFVLLGLALPVGRWWGRALTGFAVAAVAVYAGLGIAATWQRGPAVWHVTAQARWIAAQPKLPGALVSFSPSYAVDSGVPLDPRFATGVHVWRSGDLRSDAELSAFNVTSRRTLARELDRVPPAAILTGFEGRSGVNRRIIPDAVLDDWARSRGYRAVPSPYGGVLWLRQR